MFFFCSAVDRTLKVIPICHRKANFENKCILPSVEQLKAGVNAQLQVSACELQTTVLSYTLVTTNK